MDFVWLFIAALLILCTVLIMRNRMAALSQAAMLNTIRRLREQNLELSSASGEWHVMRDLLAETMVAAVFFVDTERRITFCNSAARQLSNGIATSGRSLMEALRSHELDSVVEETLNDTHELPREITIDERRFKVHVAVAVREGQKTGAVVILRDVSELQRLGRARRDFVANISHELRTPLTAIKLLVDTLRANGNGSSDPGQRRKQLDQISSQVDALAQLAQEMYDLSQIESGQIPMRMVRTPLRELVDSAITRLSPQAEQAGTALLNDVGAEVTVLADPEQIRRALSNLLHNAIKFAPQGQVTAFVAPDRQPPQAPPADVSAGEQVGTGTGMGAGADYITVAVRDTGVGISREDLPRIFERFYKANHARGKSGTGLGLAIAKHIVEAHGGQIWAESIEGQGATFYFTLPQE